MKKELVLNIEGLFDVPDYISISVEQEVHTAIEEYIEKMRNQKILSSMTKQKVRKADEVASVKRAFDYIDRQEFKSLPKREVIGKLSTALNLFIISNTPCSQTKYALLQELVE